jgi:hypothetical protein
VPAARAASPFSQTPAAIRVTLSLGEGARQALLKNAVLIPAAQVRLRQLQEYAFPTVRHLYP